MIYKTIGEELTHGRVKQISIEEKPKVKFVRSLKIDVYKNGIKK